MRSRSQTINTLNRGAGDRPAPVPATPPPGDHDKEKKDERRGIAGQWLHGALFDNVGLKFLSMVLAVTVFLLINTDKEHQITIRANVNYDYPTDKVLTSEKLRDVYVTIKGPWRRLRQFDERELGGVVLPLRDAPTGDISITPDMVHNLPPGLTVTSITPPVAHVEFDKTTEKVVEIDPLITGLPQHGYVKAEVIATPATIKVRGAERLLAALSSIRTSEVSIEGQPQHRQPGKAEELAKPAPPPGVTVVDPTQRIRVEVRINQALVTLALPNIPITPRGDGADAMKWTITPSHVDVELTGPQLLVEKTTETMIPIVKLDRASAGSPDANKPRDVDVKMEGVPTNAGLGIKVSPNRVTVTPIATIKPSAPPP